MLEIPKTVQVQTGRVAVLTNAAAAIGYGISVCQCFRLPHLAQALPRKGDAGNGGVGG